MLQEREGIKTLLGALCGGVELEDLPWCLSVCPSSCFLGELSSSFESSSFPLINLMVITCSFGFFSVLLGKVQSSLLAIILANCPIWFSKTFIVASWFWNLVSVADILSQHVLQPWLLLLWLRLVSLLSAILLASMWTIQIVLTIPWKIWVIPPSRIISIRAWIIPRMVLYSHLLH